MWIHGQNWLGIGVRDQHSEQIDDKSGAIIIAQGYQVGCGQFADDIFSEVYRAINDLFSC